MKKVICSLLICFIISNLFSSFCFADDSIKNGDIITYGSYPQSKISDVKTINELNSLLNDSDWISYNYYYGTADRSVYNIGDYMKYADVLYNKCKYRAVHFTEYRPSATCNNFPDKSKSAQYKNGYIRNQIYWFKYEPIKWLVLDEESGLICSCNILDSQSFNNTFFDDFYQDKENLYMSTDYSHCSLNEWLNSDDGFYGTAFDGVKKDIIKISDVGTEYADAELAYENCVTKVFIPSLNELENSIIGHPPTSRIESKQLGTQGTDYAKCQGLKSYKTYSDTVSLEESYWTRTIPTDSIGIKYLWHVFSSGRASADDGVFCTDFGVRPAMKIDLSNMNSNDRTKPLSYEIYYKDETEFPRISRMTDKTVISVTYSSSDESVLKVTDKGLILTEGVGTAEITQTFLKDDGSTSSNTVIITARLHWWQKLIWIFLLGFLWY